MNVTLKKSDMVLFIMEFLRSEGLDKTLVSLEEEASVSLFDYNREVSFLRKLILDGQWGDAEEFIRPLKEHPKFDYMSSIFEIKKQKFLESVESEPENNSNVEDLVKQLKELQSLCTSDIFNKLMFCLSTPSITDHVDFKNWTPTSGRLKCFTKLRSNLEIIYPCTKEENKVRPGNFLRIFKKMIGSAIYSNQKLFKNTKSLLLNVSVLDEILYDNPALDINFIIDDDIKKKNKLPKDDNELLKTSKTISKATRNEKISRSLQVDKISEIEEGEEFPKPVQEIPKNTVMKNENIEEVIEEEFQSPAGDQNYSFHEEEEKKDDDVLNKPNDNALSDLDKEEYFMKSCYDFFDYDISTLSLKKVIEDTHPIRTSCFSPKGDYFAIGTNSKSIKIFYIKSILSKFNKKNSYNFKNLPGKSAGKVKKPANDNENEDNNTDYEDVKLVYEQKNHHIGSIYCLDWSISGRLMASGSNDKTVKLMVIPDLEECYGLKDQETLELPIVGHKGTVRSVCFEPTSDLVLLSAGTVDTCIKVWDTEKGMNKTNLEGHIGDIHAVKWSNDALLCASSGKDKTIRFWDLKDYKSTSLISAIKYSEIMDISIYTKNKAIANTLIAAGHLNGTITIWDYHKKSIVKEINEHTEEVRSVSFSPDGKYLVSGSFDSKLKIFDVENKFELIGELEHSDRVVSSKWHPEVPLLISTSADKTARLWVPDTY